MGVTLRQRKNADGTTSLRLDIHHRGNRWPETLSYKLIPVKDTVDREINKALLIQARKDAAARAEGLNKGVIQVHAINQNVVVSEWMQEF